MTPILFLDFDGVIRVEDYNDCGGWSMGSIDFQPSKMQMIETICYQTNAKIVVSSDWRGEGYLSVVNNLMRGRLDKYLHEDWMTPICGHRCHEIGQWLARHNQMTNYVILDDNMRLFEDAPADMLDRLVLCNNRHGMVPSLCQKVIERLER